MTQQGKSTQKKGGWLFWLSLTIIFLLLINYCLGQIKHIIMVNRELKSSKEELAELRKKSIELKEKLNYVQTEEFVEREARQKLGLGKEDDVIYILPELPDLSALEGSPSASTTLPNWQQWLNLFWK